MVRISPNQNSIKVTDFLNLNVFGDDWTQEFANENHLNIYHPSVFLDAHFGAETNYTWTKLDGSPLKFTNWGWREPKKSNNVVLLERPTRYSGRYSENRESLLIIIFC